MKPRTILQKEVFDFSQYLPLITTEQKEWAYKECLDHKGFATKKHVTCMDCGQCFSPDLVVRKRAVCPHCETRIKVEISRKRTDKQITYFAITSVFYDYQIVRNFELVANHKQGERVKYILREILQYWIIPEEKVVMLGLLHHTQGLCDSWTGEWGIRKDSGWYKKYEVYPRKYHPDSVFKPEYTKLGINHKLEGLNLLDAIKILPYNPQAETLLKARQYELLYHIKDHSGQIYRRWPSIKICLRNRYKVNDAGVWMDYLDLLEYFRKDLHNAKYVCPKDLNKAHDRLVKKKRDIQKKLDLKKQRERAILEQKEYAKAKQAYMGLQFSKGDIQIRFLNSVQEVMEEGDELKHCVFTNKYYEKKTLLFSALVDGERTATIEVDLEKMKVVQVRGKNNSPTEYDSEIKVLIKNNMDRIRKKLSPEKQQIAA